MLFPNRKNYAIIKYTANINSERAMKEFFKKLLAGFVIGVGGIIPGLSGGILAVSMGLYKPTVDALAGFFKAPKKNFLFLLPIGIGGVIGLVLFMFLIDWLFADFRTAIICFFLGLVAGSIPSMLRECCAEGYKKHYPLYSVVGFAVAFGLILLGMLTTGGAQRAITPLNAAFGGAVIMMGVLLPGLSISFILINLGLYEGLLSVFTSPPKLFMEAHRAGQGFGECVRAACGNVGLMACALLGMVIVAVPVIFLVKRVIEKHHGPAYFVLFGILLATMLGCIIQEIVTLSASETYVFTWWRGLIYAALIAAGCLLSLKSERFIKFKEEEGGAAAEAADV